MHIVHFISFIFSCIKISVDLRYYSILSSWRVKNSQRRRLSGSGGVWVFVPMSFCVVSHLSGDVSISSWRWWRRRCSGGRWLLTVVPDLLWSAGHCLTGLQYLVGGPGVWTCQHWPCCFMVLHASQMSDRLLLKQFFRKVWQLPPVSMSTGFAWFCCEIFQVVHKQC